jgi:LysR family transcriptional activator of nhaA
VALNYNHLRYFWAVAKEGHLTRAAAQLNLSQSALSAQIRKLEEQIGHPLFERRGRRLVLSPAGQIAMQYCETIFTSGDALAQRLKTGHFEDRHPLRIGALSTLSRNFQLSLIQPLMQSGAVPFVIRSGPISELLPALEAHLLDLVLVNQVPMRDATTRWTARVIDEQPVSLIGTPERLAGRGGYADLMSSEPLVLPTRDSGFRNGIDLLAEGIDASIRIAAEVDDMAMLRLLARADIGLAALPPVVVVDELASGRLVEACRLPGVSERFSVLIPEHKFRHPALEALLQGPALD